MAELKDYSGPLLEGKFTPSEVMANFCKETLMECIEYIGRLYVLLGGNYENVIARRWGQVAAHECGNDAWMEHHPFMRKWIMKVFNIQGDDVAAFMKYYQVDPVGGLMYPMSFELKNPNYGIFSIDRCPTLEFFERTNDEASIKRICVEGGFESRFFQAEAAAINPKMKVRALKSPPRKSKDEIACCWEVKLEG